MILDVIIVGIFIFSLWFGKKNGCLKTFIKLCAIAAALVCGVIFLDKMVEILGFTPLESVLTEKIEDLANQNDINLESLLPSFVTTAFDGSNSMTQLIFIKPLVDISMAVISFAIIVLIVWVIATILLRGLARSRQRKGLIGSLDSLLGIFFGGLKGAFLIMLLLAVIVPAFTIFATDRVTEVTSMINDSVIADYIYNHNPLISFINKYI